MVVEETNVPAEMEEVQIPGKNLRRKKVIDWVDRTPDDCLCELQNFSNCLKRNMDSRYEKCMADAAHTLGQCMYIPDIFVFAQGQTAELPAKELASIQTYGRKEFAKFYKFLCSIPQIKSLAESNDQLKFWSVFAPNIHSHFKEVIVNVIWRNLGGCRQVWFRPIEPTRPHKNELTEFRVEMCSNELHDVCEFVY